MYLTLVKFKNGTAKEIVPVFLAEGFQLMKISQFDTDQ
jgi:hypothetical protein